jgi:hypothetical protein
MRKNGEGVMGISEKTDIEKQDGALLTTDGGM